MREPEILLLIGGCATGKTSFIKQILLPGYHPHFIIDTNDEYREYPDTVKAVLMPKVSRFKNEYDPDGLDWFGSLMKNNDLIVIESTGSLTADYTILQAFLKRIVVAHKHYKASLVLVYQSFNSFSPVIAQNADRVFYFHRPERNDHAYFRERGMGRINFEYLYDRITVVEWTGSNIKRLPMSIKLLDE